MVLGLGLGLRMKPRKNYKRVFLRLVAIAEQCMCGSCLVHFRGISTVYIYSTFVGILYRRQNGEVTICHFKLFFG